MPGRVQEPARHPSNDLAAGKPYPDNETERLVNIADNGTNNAFEAARLSGVRQVVYMRSNAIYPERRTLDGPRFDEDDPPGPDATNLVFGACKLFNFPKRRLRSATSPW